MPEETIHSGYDLSLDPISAADHSLPPSMPKSVDSEMLDLPEGTSEVPDSTTPPIPYFHKKHYIKYDPLGKTQLTPVLRMDASANNGNQNNIHSADLTMRNLQDHTEQVKDTLTEEPSIGDIADEWKSASEDDKSRDVADIWESVTDEDSPKAHSETGDVANVWESATDEDSPKAHSETGDVADVLESASDNDNGTPAVLSNTSAQLTVVSQLHVFPSSITITNRNRDFPLSDTWPDLDDSGQDPPSPLQSAPTSYPVFVAQDFEFLRDDQFVYSSDSE